MKILLTGATGFLGSRILALLVNFYPEHQVTVLKRSFSNTKRIEAYINKVRYFNIDEIAIGKIFEDASYDLIIHCATNFGRKITTKSEIIESNLLLPLKLLELGIKKHGGLKVFVNTDTLLDRNISDYSLSKEHFHEWLLKFSNEINSVNLYLDHFYGPNDDDSKFVTFIIKKLLSNSESIALSPGEQKRDFIFVDDVVNAIDIIIKQLDFNSVGFNEFRIATGRSISIKDFVILAKDICQNKETRLDFGALPYRDNEPMDVKIDISKLVGLGWSPAWNLSDGLKQTIDREREI